jgi:hypothetical protein
MRPAKPHTRQPGGPVNLITPRTRIHDFLPVRLFVSEGYDDTSVASLARAPWTPSSINYSGRLRQASFGDKARLSRDVVQPKSGAVAADQQQDPRLRHDADGGRPARCRNGGDRRTRCVTQWAAGEDPGPTCKAGVSRGQRQDARYWMGFRPTTPDSWPILDAASGRPRLHLAVGHGHFATTGGPSSGRLDVRMIVGQLIAVDPEPYAALRFR